MTRVAVVGHVEWMEFARIPRLPAPGDIVHASEVWEVKEGRVSRVVLRAQEALDRCRT